MRKVEDVLRLRWSAGSSVRQISSAIGIGRTTVSEYIARAEAAGISWPVPTGMDAAELERRLFKVPGQAAKDARASPDYAAVHRELRRKGMTLCLLWQEYRERYPEGVRVGKLSEGISRDSDQIR